MRWAGGRLVGLNMDLIFASFTIGTDDHQPGSWPFEVSVVLSPRPPTGLPGPNHPCPSIGSSVSSRRSPEAQADG